MSIYATLWSLKFPKFGDNHTGCDWIKVTAQGVPPHIGSPTSGLGYEDGDPYSEFLPPAVVTDEDGEGAYMRAVVIVAENTKKGTSRSHQEYMDPLVTLSGEEYANMPFPELHDRICDALRGDRPAVTLEIIGPDGTTNLYFEECNRHEIGTRGNPDARSATGDSTGSRSCGDTIRSGLE